MSAELEAQYEQVAQEMYGKSFSGLNIADKMAVGYKINRDVVEASREAEAARAREDAEHKARLRDDPNYQRREAAQRIRREAKELEAKREDAITLVTAEYGPQLPGGPERAKTLSDAELFRLAYGEGIAEEEIDSVENNERRIAEMKERKALEAQGHVGEWRSKDDLNHPDRKDA